MKARKLLIGSVLDTLRNAYVHSNSVEFGFTHFIPF